MLLYIIAIIIGISLYVIMTQYDYKHNIILPILMTLILLLFVYGYKNKYYNIFTIKNIEEMMLHELSSID